MTTSNNPSEIIQRIQSGNWNDSDLESLRQLLQNNDNETLQQLGKFNVSIDEGREIHIGDRYYCNWSDEAIQAVLAVVQQGKTVAVFNPSGNFTIYNYSNNYYREETTTVPADQTEETYNLPCPYRGLFNFSYEDSEYFFGRDVFIEELYQATQTQRFIPVLGASGSGKSSVVFAGLVPKLLTEGHWKLTHFRPGSDPFHALAQALIPLYAPNLNQTQFIIQTDELAEYFQNQEKTNQLFRVFESIHQNHPNHRILLIADQFEELYTLCNDESIRRQFLDTLLQTFRTFAEQSSLSTVLVATMRADFLSNVLSYPPLADVLRTGDIKIRSMNTEELRDVIEKPAEKLGVTFQSGLVERILDDVEKEPGNLPLLEFALTELWKKRTRQQLTHQAYAEIGEVSGALTRYADDKFNQLSESEKQQVRRIFVQLVRPGEGTEDTRRVATKTELNTDWKLVKQLADDRLVVTGRSLVISEGKKSSKQQPKSEQQTVEVVHEALIRNWGQLRQWMETDREFRTWQERLRESKRQWQEMNRDNGLFLRGAALLQAQEQLKERREELSQDEQEFIQFSQELQEQKQRQKQKQRQQILGGLVIFSVLISGVAAIAIWQWNKARIGEEKANFRAEIATLESRFNSSLSAQMASIKLNHKLQQAKIAAEDLQIIATNLLRPIVDLPEQKEINSLEGHQSDVFAVAFSPTEDLIASASGDKTVKLWKADGTLVNTFQSHEDWVTGIAFSPKGNLIATASRDNTVKLWKLNGALVKTLREHEGGVQGIAFSPNGNLIATASRDNTVKLWKPNGTLVDTLQGHENEVRSVAFSPKGNLIATASRDNTVKLWKLNGALVSTLQAHESWVNGVAFNPTGDLIATASFDRTVKLWKSDGSLVMTLVGHKNLVNAVAFSPHGDLLASVSDDNTIKLWKLDGTLVDTLRGHQNWINGVAFSPNGDLIATASRDQTVKLWKADSTPVDILRRHEDWSKGVAFSPNGDLIVTVSRDQTIKLWKSDGRLVKSLLAHESFIRDVAFSPKGDLIATASDDKTVKLWRPDGTEVKTLQGHQDNVIGVAFSSEGDLIASASQDKTVRLWTLDGTPVETLQGHEDTVWSVAFSPKEDLIATASRDTTVKLWKADGTLVNTLRGHKNSVRDVAFSPEGDLIATASRDNTVKLWKANGTLVNTLHGHEDKVYSVSFSLSGDLIATASGDNTIKLWKADGTFVTTLQGHEGEVYSVAFSPSEDLIASASQDKTVRLWNFNREQLLTHACNWVSNYLKNNPNVTEEDSRLCGVEPSATAFFLKGEHLAAQGNIDEAVSQFQQAVKLDSNFSLSLAATSLVRSGKYLIESRQFEPAISAYHQAQEFAPKLEFSASDWNKICWEGSINKEAEKVMFACNNAVKLAPDNEWIRNSRGLARTLTNDFDGAIEDFEKFIELSANKEEKAQKKRWIESLKKGDNSLINEVLKND